MGRWGTGRGLQPHCHALLCATFPLQSLLQGWMSAAQGLRPLQHIQEIPLCLQTACTLHGAEKKKKITTSQLILNFSEIEGAQKHTKPGASS